MADKYELTEQQKKELEEAVKDQNNRIGEVFSQCWESDEFKTAFIKDPKAIFKEYGINYNDEKEYAVIDSPEKTLVHVLPYEGVKKGVEGFNQSLTKRVEELGDEDGKQILLEGWKFEIYQNTHDKVYIVIPPNPDDLSPEELDMVNGGCFFALTFFIYAEVALLLVAAVVTTAAFYSMVVTASVEVTGSIVTMDAEIVNIIGNLAVGFGEDATIK